MVNEEDFAMCCFSLLPTRLDRGGWGGGGEGLEEDVSVSMVPALQPVPRASL